MIAGVKPHIAHFYDAGMEVMKSVFLFILVLNFLNSESVTL
jgi:hypothetical protein